MEGVGIWVFLLLFYLLQAFAKRKQKQKRQQQAEAQHLDDDDDESIATPRPQRPVSLQDIFNPEKLRDILGVPQPEPVEELQPTPQPVSAPKSQPHKQVEWEESVQSRPVLQHGEVRETVSKVASADITDVDESATDFRAHRMAKSDITSDRFDERKTAPGEKVVIEKLAYFDDPEDVRHAVILKEILDRPRAFRKQIR